MTGELTPQQRALCAHVLKKLRQAQKRGGVALGLAMAANEDNWGICVLLLSENLQCGELCMLVPQAHCNKDGTASQTRICRPSEQLLGRILSMVKKCGFGGAIGVDVPFGWPVEHARFASAWAAAHGLRGRGDVPERASFEFRLCDRKIRATHPGVTPLAVGGDAISQAAFAWCEVRQRMGDLLGEVDVGLKRTRGTLSTIEVYPAAFVTCVWPEFREYRKKKPLRKGLTKRILNGYNLVCDECSKEWLLWAQDRNRSDAFDALLCALSAWDYLKWRNDPHIIQVSTPEQIFGRAPNAEEEKTIQAEGWILVRTA